MENESLLKPNKIDLTPAKRCPDFDSECKDVCDPMACWQGNTLIGVAHGYCPLLVSRNE
jgi:hypothetical protein